VTVSLVPSGLRNAFIVNERTQIVGREIVEKLAAIDSLGKQTQDFPIRPKSVR
jgi:hypothetical protein